jgi:hypothetical protein
MQLPPVTESPFRVQGHPDAPPYAVVRVSSNARDAYLSLVTDTRLPADAVVAMTHAATEGGAAGATYVMERRAGAWRYLVVDPQGRIEREGSAGCAGCHASGVAEGLFGPPRPKAPATPPRE